MFRGESPASRCHLNKLTAFVVRCHVDRILDPQSLVAGYCPRTFLTCPIFFELCRLPFRLCLRPPSPNCSSVSPLSLSPHLHFVNLTCHLVLATWLHEDLLCQKSSNDQRVTSGASETSPSPLHRAGTRREERSARYPCVVTSLVAMCSIGRAETPASDSFPDSKVGPTHRLVDLGPMDQCP